MSQPDDILPIDRRRLLVGAGLAGLAAAGPAAAKPRRALCDHVDPFIGTGGHGHTYPGATTPFGMVQLSPDTSNNGWDSCSGYHQQDGSIMGFSHTHLSGTGCADLLDVLVVPATGPVLLTPGEPGRPDDGYRSRYDRATEKASPGYYRVRLTDTRIDAELTAADRVGVHRYTFPKGEAGHLLIDLQHGQKDWWEKAPATRIKNAVLRLIGDDTLVGSRQVFQWAPGRVIHFALQVSRPFKAAQLYADDQPLAADAREARGENLKCALHYDDAGAAPLVVKVGLSAVDIDGALANLRAEVPGWDFDAVHDQARAAWEKALSSIRIDGASDADATIFYTGLYHSLLAPTLFSDVDGRYRGMDQQVHTVEKGRRNYSTYSLWDTYRALHPLLTLAQPERAADVVAGLVPMAEQSPRGPSVWPLQGIETGTMNGWHAAVVLAEAHAKGVAGIDWVRTWKAFRKRAFDDDVLGLDWYKRLGFIPVDKIEEGASRTLEYAYDDWAMAHLAWAAGAKDDARALLERSRNYRHQFDASTSFMRPRNADGSWVIPFEPRAIAHMDKWRDFTEANAWQATFLTQHDLYGYMALFGGDKAFEAKLDGLFTASSEMPPGSPPDIAGLVGQYAHGNEPCHHVAYLYAYCGAHHKTQAQVRMLLKGQYQAKPDGLSGNEDCGQMSAWYVLSALGLYAVDPVGGGYVFGSPLFPKARIAVGGGRELTIEARGVGPDRFYIQSVTWNGRPHDHSWIAHAELAKGGRLVFQMGDKPNLAFGAPRATRPPSAPLFA
jgi:predicted alpha-1,2-mannosidase